MRPNAWSWLVGILVSLAIQPQVMAFGVKVSPAAPRQGDTISLVIEPDSTDNGDATPTVTLDQRSLPTFPLDAQRWRTFLPTSPLDPAGVKSLQVTVFGRTQLIKISLAKRTFPIQRIQLSPSKSGLEASETELKQVSQFKALVSPQKGWQGVFVRPNQGALSAVYGIRRYYNGVFAQDYYHRGIDYAGGLGSPVVAPAAGTVALVGLTNQGFRIHGNTVGIDHGQGVTSIFLHLSKISVQVGDTVQAGQVIGAVGSTGIATGPHLHWGLYVNGLAVDPVAWLTQPIE